MEDKNVVGADTGDQGGYVAPQIESVTTPEELEREVQYAGVTHTHP